MQLPRRPYLTERAHHVLELAHGIADGRGDPDITPAHVVLGFLEEGQNIGVTFEEARDEVRRVLGMEAA